MLTPKLAAGPLPSLFVTFDFQVTSSVYGLGFVVLGL